MIRSITIALMLSASFTLHYDQGVAQVRGRGSQLPRQEMERRIQQRFQERLTRALQLNEEQREVLFDVFGAFGEERAELLPRRREFERQSRQLMTGDGSEDRAMELLLELREIRQQEAALRIDEEDRLLEALAPSQVLQLQNLRDQFGDQIRRLGSPNGPNGPGPRRRDPAGPRRPPRR